MRSKAPLALMEQVVMVLVFALAAALCLRVFAFAGQISRRCEAVDRAALECQQMAETLKSADVRPAFSGGRAAIYYDGNWNPLPSKDEASYIMKITFLSPKVAGLGSAEIYMYTAETGEALFALTAAWQEVSDNG